MKKKKETSLVAKKDDGLILERTLLGAIAAMVPVPFVDDLLQQRARTALLRELATRAGLRLDGKALKALAANRDSSLVEMATRSAGLRLIVTFLRGAAIPMRVAERARIALHTYQLATLLDHYARTHHQGLDLDAVRARSLRAAFDEVIDATSVGLRDLRSPESHGKALRETFDTQWTRLGKALP